MWITDYVSVTLQSNYCSFHRAFQWVCWFFWLLSWFVALTDSLGHSVKFKLSLIKFGNLYSTALSLNHLWLIVFDTWTESDWIIRLTSIKCFFFFRTVKSDDIRIMVRETLKTSRCLHLQCFNVLFQLSCTMQDYRAKILNSESCFVHNLE